MVTADARYSPKKLSTHKSILVCIENITCIQCVSERFHVTKMPTWLVSIWYCIRCPLLCIYQNKCILWKSSFRLLKKNLIIDSLLAAKFFKLNMLFNFTSFWYFTLTVCWCVSTCLLLYSSWAISWKIRRALFFYKYK